MKPHRTATLQAIKSKAESAPALAAGVDSTPPPSLPSLPTPPPPKN